MYIYFYAAQIPKLFIFFFSPIFVLIELVFPRPPLIVVVYVNLVLESKQANKQAGIILIILLPYPSNIH